MTKRKLKALFLAVIMIVLALGTTLSVEAAPKNKAAAVDATLAPPAIFLQSQYALLNPAVAASCKNDANAMFRHYMSAGVRNGERLFATPLPLPVERLFLYMSYNRSAYVANGLNPTFQYFNINNYIAQNPGLVKVYGMNLPMYLYHYLNYGVYEGKSSGTYYDPAKVVLWNSAVAELNNVKMSPAKILSNYTAFTGQLTTAAISNPLPPVPAPAPTYTPSSSSKHEHNWKYESINDEKHWKECRDCDEKYKEDHHYHVYSQVNGTDATRHTLKCSKCDHKMAELHYDGNGDGKCDKCGATVSPTPHVHHFVPQTTGQTVTQHVLRCSCGARMMENHTPGYTFNNGSNPCTHTVVCAICNYVINSADPCDMNGTGASCSKCGHIQGVIPPTHTHVWGAWTWVDGTTNHRRVCTAAGCTEPPASETEACDHSGAGETCSVCGHTYPAAHTTHSYTDHYVDNNDGTHEAYCSCGEHQTATCSPNGAGDTCASCGHNFPAAHTHTWSNDWVNNHDGTHSRACTGDGCSAVQNDYCNHNGEGGSCDVCGYDWS